MPARLTVHYPDRPTRSILLGADGDYTIGRDPECRIALDDDRVSRRHARLTASGDAWQLADLGSKNGTSVDGRQIAGAAPLADGCWLSFGGLIAGFERVSAGDLEQQSAGELRRLRTTLDLQRKLSPQAGLGPLLDRILKSALSVTDGERAFILLAAGEADLQVAAAAGIRAEELVEGEFSGSVGAIDRALAEREAVVVADARADTFLGIRPSVVAGGIRCLACVPLLALEQLLGVIYLDSRAAGAAFSDLDVQILEALAAHAALAIAVAGLDSELRDVQGALPTQIAQLSEDRSQVSWSGIRAAHRQPEGGGGSQR